MHAAVFLDRDDTLIRNSDLGARLEFAGDLYDPDFVELLPGVADACARLQRHHFKLVVITNQGAVARGRCTIDDVERTNTRLIDLLKHRDVTIDAVYYCPYHPKGTTPPYNVEHPWRKPAPGMILDAARTLDLDLARSYLVGDAPRDIEAGHAAGIPDAHNLLVGNHEDATYASLADAADFIVAHAHREQSA